MAQILVAAFAALAAAACFAEEIGGAVLPMSAPLLNGDAKAIAQKLRAIKERGAISRFVLSSPGHSVRINGMMGVDAYRKIGCTLRAVREAVASDGIDVGYMMLPTMNCGINHPWQKYTREDGSVREFTACFGDEGFRRDFAAKCAAVDAEAKPPFHMFGDDFRYWGFGCFCEDHLRRFAELTGVRRDRAALVKGLKRSDRRGDELRMAWHLFQFEDLKRMAEATAAAVADASPDTRLVYCAPGRFPERESAMMATILAGRHRPAIRWWGAVYGHDFPVEASGLLFCAQWSKENLDPDMETLYEADPCPHSRFYASAARMSALISATTAMGYTEPLFDAISGRADALTTSPDYLDMYRQDVARFAAVKREAATGRIVGVQVAFNPYVRIGDKWDAKRPRDEKAWYRTLNRLGIPVTTAESPVKLLAGHHAFRYMDGAAITNLLSGGVFLDGAAAEALTEMGFAGLIGVKAALRDKIDFAGERLASEGAQITFPCAFHQNYGLDGSAVSRLSSIGAENLAVFSSKKGDQPSITYFENSLGGKIAVMAVNLAGCKSPNIFSFAKRDFLVGLFRRIGGDRVVPVRVIDRANVMLLANDDGRRLFAHAVNLSCDPADSFVFEVTEPHAGGNVEILDGAEWVAADAKWDGRRVAVRPSAKTNVYGTLIIRIAK
ncbi:MAG: hypothetical protein IJH50_08690 [Kiritimatiellae bacterium]|nr:hypothetical protein [Kiritimatiellia bacterium]